MKIYDVTLPIKTGMLVYPGDPGVIIDVKTTVAKDGVGQSYFSMSSHTGTHVDAPNHFVAGGNGVDQISLEKLIGPCKVLDLTQIGRLEILPEDLGEVQKGDRKSSCRKSTERVR